MWENNFLLKRLGICLFVWSIFCFIAKKKRSREANKGLQLQEGSFAEKVASGFG